jgi:hypothetical protein
MLTLSACDSPAFSCSFTIIQNNANSRSIFLEFASNVFHVTPAEPEYEVIQQQVSFVTMMWGEEIRVVRLCALCHNLPGKRVMLYFVSLKTGC